MKNHKIENIKGESLKHYIVKQFVYKLLLNRGYSVETDYSLINNHINRDADVYARDTRFQKIKVMIVEVEDVLTKKLKSDLQNFYGRNLKIIHTKKVPNDLVEMHKYLKQELKI